MWPRDFLPPEVRGSLAEVVQLQPHRFLKKQKKKGFCTSSQADGRKQAKIITIKSC